MSDLKCGCGAAVFERREYVRRVDSGDEVVYYRYRCQGCGSESQEFRPAPPPVSAETVLIESSRAGSRTR